MKDKVTCPNVSPVEHGVPPCDIYVPTIIKEIRMRIVDGNYECMINDDGFWRGCEYNATERTVKFSA